MWTEKMVVAMTMTVTMMMIIKTRKSENSSKLILMPFIESLHLFHFKMYTVAVYIFMLTLYLLSTMSLRFLSNVCNITCSAKIIPTIYSKSLQHDALV